MVNIFDHFTIVYQLSKYISWDDLFSVKKLNQLCDEICEREIQRRCSGVQNGYMLIPKDNCPRKSKMQRLSDTQDNINHLQFYQPRLVILFTNKKNTKGLEDVILRQSDVNGVICRIYSTRGCLGVTKEELFQCTSARRGGLWWLSLPCEVDVHLMTTDSEIRPDSKLVVVFNDSNSTNVYGTDVFNNHDDSATNPVIYCGGLVRGIELFNHDKQCFEKAEHLSIVFGGEDLHVDYLVMDEEYQEIEGLRIEFSALKTRNDRAFKNKKIKHQCALLFSCYLRCSISFDDETSRKSEYEIFREYFPHMAVQGVFCEGEIFHVNEGVVKLVKSLDPEVIEGLSSIYVILTWTIQ